MIKWKISIPDALKAAGYSSYRIRQEAIFPGSVYTKLKNGETAVSLKTVDTLCRLLEKQPGDLLEYEENSAD